MLEAAAEQAPLIGQVRSFLTWAGPGRKLTATGRIGLADARHLVELLGTGDTIDPEIGGRVHSVIQAAMGWTGSHLHMFRIGGREYRPACLGEELETLDESQFRIGDLMKPGDRAGYEYDFGDGWDHELDRG